MSTFNYMNEKGEEYIAVRCNQCGRTLYTEWEGQNFRTAITEIKQKGWLNTRVNGDWMHYCPKCFETIRSGINETPQQTRRGGQQKTANIYEQKARADAMRTQGRKGCKATRINMAFAPENIEFIKIMSRATGQNMTEFTNFVIEAYRNEHPDIYEKAKAVIRLAERQGAAYEV